MKACRSEVFGRENEADRLVFSFLSILCIEKVHLESKYYCKVREK